MPHGLDAQTGLLSQSTQFNSEVGFHIRPHRLARSRTPPSQGGNVGSNPTAATMAR